MANNFYGVAFGSIKVFDNDGAKIVDPVIMDIDIFTGNAIHAPFDCTVVIHMVNHNMRFTGNEDMDHKVVGATIAPYLGSPVTDGVFFEKSPGPWIDFIGWVFANLLAIWTCPAIFIILRNSGFATRCIYHELVITGRAFHIPAVAHGCNRHQTEESYSVKPLSQNGVPFILNEYVIHIVAAWPKSIYKFLLI